MDCDEKLQRRDHGIYTVKVHGQVHHFPDDLIPLDDSKRLDACIVENLVAVMDSNPYSLFLKQASALENIDEYHIVIRSDPGLDQRAYNRPTSMEVAGIWTEDESGETNLSEAWDIRVYTKSGSSHKV
ncbi:hypothetical protein LIER_18124 [Lithospermum erythrorhizon]|uniref:Uncharacterized protein n=1 Tax=Lithospermum erythrorhizon TaxID=34254 RepID=A0AAV3QCU3_LITER